MPSSIKPILVEKKKKFFSSTADGSLLMVLRVTHLSDRVCDDGEYDHVLRRCRVNWARGQSISQELDQTLIQFTL